MCRPSILLCILEFEFFSLDIMVNLHTFLVHIRGIVIKICIRHQRLSYWLSDDNFNLDRIYIHMRETLKGTLVIFFYFLQMPLNLNFNKGNSYLNNTMKCNMWCKSQIFFSYLIFEHNLLSRLVQIYGGIVIGLRKHVVGYSIRG